ncbi:MAG: MopE-related protein [Deltaproteobacteria bacterium]|nr:MopE-related protein [Myxococcales bacterium]MDP3214343.1 MopE-related protein [Deltaproteobacteria bacterium]
MARRTPAAALLLTAALGCATVSEGDGTYNDRDAGGDDLGGPKDTGSGKIDAADEAPGDALPTAADRPDAGDASDAPEVSPDAPVIMDVTADAPAADLGSGNCAEGTTRGCYTGLPATRGVGLCADGFQRCVGGRWGVECNGQIRPQTEECNTIDDDCDGVVDNIAVVVCYTGPPATRRVGICHEGMRRCNGTGTPLCTGQVVPETREVCANGRDDNCNGMTDEAGCL